MPLNESLNLAEHKIGIEIATLGLHLIAGTTDFQKENVIEWMSRKHGLH